MKRALIRIMTAAAVALLPLSLGCGSGSWSPGSGDSRAAGGLRTRIEPTYRRPVIVDPAANNDPTADPLGAEPAPPDELGGRSIDDVPIYDEDGPPAGGGSGTDPGTDPEPEDPGTDPAPDPYVDGGGATDPEPDPYVDGSGGGNTDPEPDPYVDGGGGSTDPEPDPYVDGGGGSTDPEPDPYVDGSGPSSEFLSVFAPRVAAGPVVSGDPTDNTLYRLWGAAAASGTLTFEYQQFDQPRRFSGQVYHAARQALETWAEALGQRRLFGLSYHRLGRREPIRDGHSIITWRVFEGPAADAPVAVFLWDDGGRVVEADIVLNLNSPLAVNRLKGKHARADASAYDAQALLTQMLGHVLGLDALDDPAAVAATMYGVIGRGEVAKQTLTPGDIAGARAAAPPASAERRRRKGR